MFMTFPDPRLRCDFSRSQAHVVFFSNPGRVVTFLVPRAWEPGRVMTSPNPGFASLRLGNGVTCPTFHMKLKTFMLTMPESLDSSYVIVINFPSNRKFLLRIEILVGSGFD